MFKTATNISLVVFRNPQDTSYHQIEVFKCPFIISMQAIVSIVKVKVNTRFVVCPFISSIQAIVLIVKVKFKGKVGGDRPFPVHQEQDFLFSLQVIFFGVAVKVKVSGERLVPVYLEQEQRSGIEWSHTYRWLPGNSARLAAEG